MISASNHRGAGWPWVEEGGVAAIPQADLSRLPKISIVTPSFNQGRFLEETIRSVLLQNYPKLEYIVIDGGSTDQSVVVIRKYAGLMAHWESARDRGQSHAINKGLSHCTGDLFNWINSDDLLTPGALWAVARAWQAGQRRIISGHTEFFDERGTCETIRAGGQTLRNFVRFWEADGWGWAQPGTFVPLTEIKGIGGVQEHLKYCFDYQMMVQMLARGCEVTYVDQILAKFRLHEASKTVGSREAFRLERVPALRAMKDLPVQVAPREWDGQQARRLVDVGLQAFRKGEVTRSVRLFGRALAASPVSAVGEVRTRMRRKMASTS